MSDEHIKLRSDSKIPDCLPIKAILLILLMFLRLIQQTYLSSVDKTLFTPLLFYLTADDLKNKMLNRQSF